MLSQTVEYALRAVVYLAKRTGVPSRTSDIALQTKVPQAYLSKVLQSLRKKGIVESHRGGGGGVSLSADPEELTVWDVVQAVDPMCRITTCPLGLKEHGENLCPLHKRMDAAIGVVEEAFRESTVAEILADPNKSIPLNDKL